MAEYTDPYGRTFQAHVASSGQVTYGGQTIGQANPITQQYVSTSAPQNDRNLREEMRLGFTIGERQARGFYSAQNELTQKGQERLDYLQRTQGYIPGVPSPESNQSFSERNLTGRVTATSSRSLSAPLEIIKTPENYRQTPFEKGGQFSQYATGTTASYAFYANQQPEKYGMILESGKLIDTSKPVEIPPEISSDANIYKASENLAKESTTYEYAPTSKSGVAYSSKLLPSGIIITEPTFFEVGAKPSNIANPYEPQLRGGFPAVVYVSQIERGAYKENQNTVKVPLPVTTSQKIEEVQEKRLSPIEQRVLGAMAFSEEVQKGIENLGIGEFKPIKGVSETSESFSKGISKMGGENIPTYFASSVAGAPASLIKTPENIGKTAAAGFGVAELAMTDQSSFRQAARTSAVNLLATTSEEQGGIWTLSPKFITENVGLVATGRIFDIALPKAAKSVGLESAAKPKISLTEVDRAQLKIAAKTYFEKVKSEYKQAKIEEKPYTPPEPPIVKTKAGEIKVMASGIQTRYTLPSPRTSYMLQSAGSPMAGRSKFASSVSASKEVSYIEVPSVFGETRRVPYGSENSLVWDRYVRDYVQKPEKEFLTEEGMPVGRFQLQLMEKKQVAIEKRVGIPSLSSQKLEKTQNKMAQKEREIMPSRMFLAAKTSSLERSYTAQKIPSKEKQTSIERMLTPQKAITTQKIPQVERIVQPQRSVQTIKTFQPTRQIFKQAFYQPQITKEGRIPKLILPTGNEYFEKQKKKKFKFKKHKAKTPKYTPSIISIVSGYKAKLPKGIKGSKIALSGLEIRPISV